MDLRAAAWTRHDGRLVLVVKDGDSWRVVDPGFKPYFFVPRSAVDEVEKAARRLRVKAGFERGDFKAFGTGDELVKAEVEFPSDVKRIRDSLHRRGVKTFEADVPFVTRWMIDNDIHASPNPRILFFDVEADARLGMPLPGDPRLVDQRVLSIAAVDEEGREYFFCSDDERETLRGFRDVALNYDLLVGWNIERFDIPYLEHHYRKWGLSPPFRVVSCLDLMLIYKDLYLVSGSYRLDDVAEKELGVGKYLNLYESGGAETLWRWFTGDRGALYEYNMTDTWILWKLFEKWSRDSGLKTLITSIVGEGYVLYDAFYYRSRIIDTVILRKGFEMTPRQVFPTKARVEKERAVPGGLVLNPQAGIYRYVAAADFASLYPSIIITFNISPETLDDEAGEIRTPLHRFRGSPRGILPGILTSLVEKRMHYKSLLKKHPEGSVEYTRAQAMQAALKYLINSIYGINAYPGFRLFNASVAESVTATGQALMLAIKRIFEDLGFTVLYGDTDSVFVWRADLYDRFRGSPASLVEYFEEILDQVNARLREHVVSEYGAPEDAYCVKLELEKIFDKLFVPPAKKRYVGIPVYGIEKYTAKSRSRVMNMDIRGFELVRGDIPPAIRKVEADVFKILLSSETLAEASRRIAEYLDWVKKLLYSGCLDTELVMRKTVTRDVDTYKQSSVHVKAAAKLRDRGLFRPGESVFFVVTGRADNGYVAEPVVEGLPIPKPDYDYYWDRLRQTVERILGQAGVRETAEVSLTEWL